MTRPVAGGSGVTITDVSGGLTASYSGAMRLAAVLDDAGDRVRELAGTGARVAASPDLVASALLAPFTGAAAEAAVLEATGMLLPCSLELELTAAAVRQAVMLLRAADEAVDIGLHLEEYAAGYAAATGIKMLPGETVAVGVAVGVAASQAPPSWWAAADDTAADWVADHPGLAQAGVGVLPGVLDGLLGTPGAHPTMASAAGFVAGLHHEDGEAVTTPTGTQVPDSQTVPTSLADAIEHLGQVNELPDGDIEIQTITLPDGTRHHIVYLPGTDDLNPLSHDEQVRDGQGNNELIAHQQTAYGHGIEQALADAGVQPGEPVMLVGHSQGGMQAVALASQGTPYDITQVVTAGSPVAGVDLPDGVEAISLEHAGDAVPLLDAGDNPDATNHVTVTFDSGSDGFLANHSLTHYAAGAAAADDSPDPAISHAIDDASAFFQPGEVTSTVYTITRP